MSQDKPVLTDTQIEEFRAVLVHGAPGPAALLSDEEYERRADTLCDLALIGLERQGSGEPPEPPLEKGGLEKRLEHAINSVSAENQSNTPDFILSNFLMNALAAVDTAIQQRDKWYGIRPAPGWAAAPQAQDAQTGPTDTPPAP